MPNWNDVLKEIQSHAQSHAIEAQNHSNQVRGALDAIRRKYLNALQDYTAET